ncbi:hypothetical protein BH09BAC6_BH09BAC6_22630 [soil metagenome]|jgi:hypothetical protein
MVLWGDNFNGVAIYTVPGEERIACTIGAGNN